MNKVKMIKTVGGIIISVGVGAIVENAIKCTTPNNMGIIKKVCIVVGGFVLVGMICDAATEYAERQFDSTVNQVKNMVKNQEQENKVNS